MTAAQALGLFKIAVRLIAAIQDSKWYRKGREAAYAEQTEEARQRIAEADAARADVDAFASGKLRDPRQRD